MVAGIGISDLRILPALLPIKLAGINNDTAQSGTMSTDELGCGMHYDIRTVLDRSDQIGGTEGIVDDNRKTMLMRKLRDGINIRDIRIGIAQCLHVYQLGVGANGSLNLCFIMYVHEGGLNAELLQGMCKQIIAAAVDRLLSHDVVTLSSQSLYRIGDGCRTAGSRQSRNTTLQRSNSLLQHILGGVGQTSINISCVSKSESCCRML